MRVPVETGFCADCPAMVDYLTGPAVDCPPRMRPKVSADIARIANAPHEFLRKILLEMKKRIVHSQRGRQGGYTLGREPGRPCSRTLFGPATALRPCANILMDQHCVDCADKEQCDIRWVLTPAHEATAKVLEAHPLQPRGVPSGSSEIRVKSAIPQGKLISY